MTTPLLTCPSPVLGDIHNTSWSRPPGNTDFRLTRTAYGHEVAGGVKAIDLGDGNIDRDNCYAMFGGVVKEHRTRDGVITIESLSGRWRAVYAHLAIDSTFWQTYWGKVVPDATLLGHVSNTYPPPTILPTHLHIQLGQLVYGNWRWLDPWPLLAINQFVILNGAGINIRTAPDLSSAAIYATSRPDGIHHWTMANGLGPVIAPLSEKMRVLHPPFTIAENLVWVKALLNGQIVFISKNLIHFDV